MLSCLSAVSRARWSATCSAFLLALHPILMLRSFSPNYSAMQNEKYPLHRSLFSLFSSLLPNKSLCATQACSYVPTGTTQYKLRILYACKLYIPFLLPLRVYCRAKLWAPECTLSFNSMCCVFGLPCTLLWLLPCDTMHPGVHIGCCRNQTVAPIARVTPSPLPHLTPCPV